MALGAKHRKMLEGWYQQHKLRIALYRGQTPIAAVLAIIEEFDLADHIQGRELLLSAQAYQELAELCMKRRGWDLANPVSSGASRIVLSDHDNEKHADNAPDRDYLLCRDLHQQLRLLGKPATLPEGISLRLPYWQVQLSDYQNLILVENLDVFDQFAQFELPDSITQHATLLVYRGDADYPGHAMKQLLASAHATLKVISCCDFDPAGFAIAHSSPAITHALWPKLEADHIKQAQTTKRREDYQKQIKRLGGKEHASQRLVGWPEQWARCLHSKTSVIQQLMIKLQIPLFLEKRQQVQAE